MTNKELYNLSTDKMLKMTKQELIKSLRKVAPTINKKYDTLAKYDTPAYRQLKESGGKLSFNSNSTLSQLRKEFVRAQKFGKARTNTIKGFKDLQVQLYGNFSDKLDNDDKKRIWEIYRKLENTDTYMIRYKGSDYIIEQIIKHVTNGKSDDDVLSEMEIQFEKEYEESSSPWDIDLDMEDEDFNPFE